MKALFLRIALVSALMVSLAAFAPAAFAQEHGDEGEEVTTHGDSSSIIGGPNWDDVKSVTIWSIVAIGGGCAVLGVLYMLKRKVGGFPENPDWVAPITIMPSSGLPQDDGAGHGHDAPDAHGSHAPAH